MADNKNESVVEETTKSAAEEAATQEQPKEETPKVDLSKFKSKLLTTRSCT